MSYQVSQVGQVPVATEIQRQQVRYNPSFRSANVTYLENSPENDVYEKNGMSTGGKVTLVTLGAIAVAGLVDQFAFKGKYRNMLWTKLQNAWNSIRNKADDKLIDPKPSVDNSLPISSKKTNRIPYSEVADVPTTHVDNPSVRIKGMNQREFDAHLLQEELDRTYNSTPVRYKGKMNRKQKAALKANNEAAARATAEACQIGNNAKGVENLEALKAGNPVSKPQAKPVVDAVQQQIKGIEGNIQKLEQRIAGAKKNGNKAESVKNLEAQLANLQKKLEQLKA